MGAQLESAIEEAISWLDNNPSAEKEEYEEKQSRWRALPCQFSRKWLEQPEVCPVVCQAVCQAVCLEAACLTWVVPLLLMIQLAVLLLKRSIKRFNVPRIFRILI